MSCANSRPDENNGEYSVLYNLMQFKTTLFWVFSGTKKPQDGAFSEKQGLIQESISVPLPWWSKAGWHI